jgi:hypothetical protein
MAKPNRFTSNTSNAQKVTVSKQDFYGVSPKRIQHLKQSLAKGRIVLTTKAEEAALRAKGLN